LVLACAVLPVRVIAVLLAPPCVAPRRLQMAIFSQADPDIAIGWRHPQLFNPPPRGSGQAATIGADIAETPACPFAANAGILVRDVDKAVCHDGSKTMRCAGENTQASRQVPARVLPMLPCCAKHPSQVLRCSQSAARHSNCTCTTHGFTGIFSAEIWFFCLIRRRKGQARDMDTEHDWSMADQVRTFDWSRTPLGAQDQWPVALKITVDLILRSRFPKCLCWGPEMITIYNDAFIPILGQKRVLSGSAVQSYLGRSLGRDWPLCSKRAGGAIDLYQELCADG